MVATELILPWNIQVVELDFLYPSEGIHLRWETGYRITSIAATPDQAAFILSIPKRKPMDETQETLRTSAFPSTHVKVGIWYCIHYSCSLFSNRFSSALFLSIYQSDTGQKKSGKMGEEPVYFLGLLRANCVLTCMLKLQGAQIGFSNVPISYSDCKGWPCP